MPKRKPTREELECAAAAEIAARAAARTREGLERALAAELDARAAAALRVKARRKKKINSITELEAESDAKRQQLELEAVQEIQNKKLTLKRRQQEEWLRQKRQLQTQK
jgi:hypothetical protein